MSLLHGNIKEQFSTGHILIKKAGYGVLFMLPIFNNIVTLIVRVIKAQHAPDVTVLHSLRVVYG